MSFCTTINCMDGRIQLPIIQFLQQRFNVEFVDSITEPGPVHIFAKTTDLMVLNSIITRIDISINRHGSKGLAVCAHPDCCGNPIDDDLQKAQLERSVIFLKETYPNTDVIGVWIEKNQQPTEYC